MFWFGDGEKGSFLSERLVWNLVYGGGLAWDLVNFCG